MASPPSGTEGWLKAGVVGAPICFNNRLMYSPTTSPYGYSSFPKEENGDRIDFLVTPIWDTIVCQ